MLPILFHTEMVRDILEGRKTVTRRVVTPQPPAGVTQLYHGAAPGRWRSPGKDVWVEIRAPYQPGDILWVRETWSTSDGSYLYRAWPGEGMEPERQDWAMKEMGLKWRPSIHMPREAARIFLRVTGVRVERLRDMVLADVLMEGIKETDEYEKTWDRWHQAWNQTIKPADLPVYGWEANPWVWVIDFERISEEEAEGAAALLACRGPLPGADRKED